MERARMIGQGIFTSMETVQLYMPAVCCGDQRDLIVRIAVAVGILLFEGLEHLIEILYRAGLLGNADILHPFGAVEAGVALNGAGMKDVGETVDLIVHAGDGGLHIGVLLEHVLDVGRILIDEVGQIEEHALRAVGVLIGGGAGVVTENDIAVLTADQRNVLLLGPGARVVNFKIKVDVGDLAQALEDLELAPIGSAGVLAAHDLEGDRLFHDGVFANGGHIALRLLRRSGVGCGLGCAAVFGRGFRLGCAGREHTEAQRQCEKQGKRFFQIHQISSSIHFIMCNMDASGKQQLIP